MITTDFQRDDCQLGRRRVTYARLQREYRCNACGGRLNLRWDEEQAENWHIACLGCGSSDFIHERELQHQEAEADEVVVGLPDELAKLLGVRREPIRVMSLYPEVVEI